MRFALGMDNREIARAMGKTDGATKVLLHRAIKQLEGIGDGDVNAVRATTPTSSRCCASRWRRSTRPSTLKARVETTLQELTDARRRRARVVGDRRDARPAQLGAPGGRERRRVTAGTALVVLRVRNERKKRAAASSDPLDLAARTLRAAAGEARKLARRD